jgi:hypothetical protein
VSSHIHDHAALARTFSQAQMARLNLKGKTNMVELDRKNVPPSRLNGASVEGAQEVLT